MPLTSQAVLTVLTFEGTERTGEFKTERAIILAVLYNRSNHYVTKLPAPLILLERMNDFHFATSWCDGAICCASITLKEKHTRFLPTNTKTWGLLGSKIFDMIWTGSVENLPKPEMHKFKFYTWSKRDLAAAWWSINEQLQLSRTTVHAIFPARHPVYLKKHIFLMWCWRCIK